MPRVLVIPFVFLAVVACRPNEDEGKTIFINNTLIVGPDVFGPGPGPSPSPGAGTCGTVVSVRVHFFGVRCPGSPPRNGEGILPLDCIGDVTATPKLQSGDDAPEVVHGQNILWQVTEGVERIRLVESGQTAFNKTAVPRAVGPVRIQATVTPPGCGPITGAFGFDVVN